MIQHQAGLLHGIYTRLGLICQLLFPESDPGPDIEPLEMHYLSDIYAVAIRDLGA